MNQFASLAKLDDDATILNEVLVAADDATELNEALIADDDARK